MKYEVTFLFTHNNSLTIKVDGKNEDEAMEKVVSYKVIKFISLTFPNENLIDLDIRLSKDQSEKCVFELQKSDNDNYLVIEKNSMSVIEFIKGEFENARFTELFDDEEKKSDYDEIKRKATRWLMRHHPEIL